MPIETTNANSAPHTRRRATLRRPSFRPAVTAPVQIVGFVPVYDSSLVDCREFIDDCCYTNPVFANESGGNAWENDKSSFLFGMPSAPHPAVPGSPNYSITFRLEKLVSAVWTVQTVLNNNNNGTFYNVGTITGFPAYIGYQIDWQKGLQNFDYGNYRLKVSATTYGVVKTLYSFPFCLHTYSCDNVHKTTRFEATINTKIGSIDDQTAMFDLTGINWYDSVRMKGFFGYEKSEYSEVNIEYDNGQVNKIRDEAIQKYQWKSGRLPKYIHDRFKAYGLMADTL